MFTRTRQARLDRADGHAERTGDFFVAQAVDLPEDDHGPLIEGQTFERLPDALRRFALLEDAVRHRELPHVGQLAVGRRVFVEGDLL